LILGAKQLKFLVDVGVGRKVEEWLINNGYDVLAVRDIDPRMSDEKVLRKSVDEKRMVVTMDKDFGELVYHSGLPHAGVLLLRLEDANADEKVKIVRKIITDYSGKLFNRFCVYQGGRFRIKH
jgi:predicted nuclease of predicted toxin-antitoxin system